jgi:hypothetical protein
MIPKEADPVGEVTFALTLSDGEAFLRHQAKGSDSSALWLLGLVAGLGLVFFSCLGIPKGGIDVVSFLPSCRQHL